MRFMRFYGDYGIFLGFFRKVYEICLSDLPLGFRRQKNIGNQPLYHFLFYSQFLIIEGNIQNFQEIIRWN